MYEQLKQFEAFQINTEYLFKFHRYVVMIKLFDFEMNINNIE